MRTEPLRDTALPIPAAHEQTPRIGKVGPNAIIQTAAALREIVGEETTAGIFQSAGLPRYLTQPPGEMIEERDAALLFAAIRHRLPETTAADVLRHAGRLTGRYIIANRIPAPAQRLIGALPAMIGARLLLSAIAKHAWTFAGTGRVVCNYGPALSISITANPLATQDCPWHVGVFDTLFCDLVSPRIHTRHETCCAHGETTCRTRIVLG